MTVRSLRVLIVDDEVDIVSVLKQGLKLTGIDADGFSDPAEAFDAFKPGFYDFVISDIKMPQMSGFDLAKAVFPQLQAKRFIKKPIRYKDLAELLIADNANQAIKEDSPVVNSILRSQKDTLQ